MHGCGKSDRPIVPGKLPNNGIGAPTPAEEVEGRGLTKGNSFRRNRFRTQRRRRDASMANPKRARSGKPRTQPRVSAYPLSTDLQNPLERIRQAASRDKGLRFTTLWHHVYHVALLREAYFSLKQKAAPGVDGETWQHYGENLEENLEDLSSRLKRGAYRAKPVRRVYIPKTDGRLRPLGVPVLEDKLVQRATTEVLNAIYETDFKGFSYGFRPGRSPHHALDALYLGIVTRKVRWVLDADIRGFLETSSYYTPAS